ncbi:hypothetical protein SEPCBS57363_001470 [Sporothrix epigloea]|uniref:Uncharacterized protein n=1 Tax=Sporothrix epigloea TaxID=1892477 RepID=A0ABP0DAH5_9PEZI
MARADEKYEGDTGLEGSDHRAQAVKVTRARLEKGHSPQGWSWAMMDHGIVQAEASPVTVLSDLTTTEELGAAQDARRARRHYQANPSSLMFERR